MTWSDQPLTAFDLETTGVDPTADRVVTASVLHIKPSAGTVHTRSWLVNPSIDIPDEATNVHGITTEHARSHGDAPEVALPQITHALNQAWNNGEPVVIYNAPYDLTLLNSELRRYNLAPFTTGHVVDPLVIDRAADPYRPGSRKLTAVAAHYGVPLPEQDAHGAVADALTTARVAWKIARDYPAEIGSAPLERLHAWQTKWHAEWTAQLEQWIAQQPDSDPKTIPRGWPLQEAPNTRTEEETTR